MFLIKHFFSNIANSNHLQIKCDHIIICKIEKPTFLPYKSGKMCSCWYKTRTRDDGLIITPTTHLQYTFINACDIIPNEMFQRLIAIDKNIRHNTIAETTKNICIFKYANGLSGK